MSDPAAFLLARLAEWEADALAAMPDPHGDQIAREVRQNPWDLMAVGGRSPLTAHMARHDPARMLRQVAAMRRAVELHARVNVDECAACAGYEGELGTWPCDTIRALAAIFPDHPDYREEWAHG